MPSIASCAAGYACGFSQRLPGRIQTLREPLSILPGIQERSPRARKVHLIARHQLHPMHERSSSNEAVPDRARVGDMHLGASKSDSSVHRQNSPRESRQNMVQHPGAKQGSLRRIAPLHLQDSEFQLLNRGRRNLEFLCLYAGGPLCHVPIHVSTAALPQFGDDIGIEEIHQETSAGLARSRGSAASNSISSPLGIASRSPIF
jgi:hypothetical protein